MENAYHRLRPMGGMPNSDLPLVVMTGAVQAGEATPDATAARLEAHGWQGTWTYTVFDYWHYHLTGHEVLVCVSGEALIGFGGEKAEGGVALPMRPGDAVVIPAGVGHKRLGEAPGFAVVGAYPPEQDGTVTRAGTVDLEEARQRLAALDLPVTDPVTGEAPGALGPWREA